MMVSIIVVVIISIVSLLLIQFRRNYTKGEESSVVLQESGLMMAMLRTDFINAVAPPGSEKDCCSKAILVEGPNLMFQIFRDVEGTIETVKYSLLRDPTSPDRGSLVRIQGTGKPKLLVDRHVASLTWNMGTELFTGAASGTRRVWLDLDITLGGVGKPGIKPKLLRLNTKLFPTRLNRQLH